MGYKVDLRDIYFNLFEVLGIESLSQFEAYKDFSVDDYRMIISEAEKLAVNIIAPTLLPTDQNGAKFIDGKVVVPDEIREAFHKFNEGGWGAVTASPEFGGQGLPASVSAAVVDICTAANTGFRRVALTGTMT